MHFLCGMACHWRGVLLCLPAAAVTAKPGFLPPGALATYTEVFDKTCATEPVWSLRRDMGWGSMSGARPPVFTALLFWCLTAVLCQAA